MKTAIYRFQDNNWNVHPVSHQLVDDSVNLVLCFTAKKILQDRGTYESLKIKFPQADIAMCSTAGEIFQDEVLDGELMVIAIHFERTGIHSCALNIMDYSNSYAVGMALAKQLPKEQLRHVLVLSDGSKVNGSELVKGLAIQFDKEVLITGGLAGDGADFHSTLVGLNEQPKEGCVLAIGLYGDHIHVAHGSQGGWEIFGLEKRVTSSSGNVLMEMEDQNALTLYKKYLGPESGNLPGSALLFPLSVTIPGADKPVVRTILSINEEDQSMTFAGDIPVGSKVRFMKANFDRLTHAAAEAADFIATKSTTPDFSLLISCIGRKLVLGEKTTEEVKAVSKIFGDNAIQAGFYSYGEITPFNEGGKCQLHNQTMTITSFYER
jgi:hypothetical protein